MIKSVTFLEAGYTKQLEFFINPKKKSLRHQKFPSSVCVIEHSKEGIILLDTGYTEAFLEATKYFPEKFYALITPVSIPHEKTALSQLKQMGIQPSDVKTIILTHFHADHISGLRDFKNANFIYSEKEYQYFQHLSRIGQIKSAFLKHLLPDFFIHQSRPITTESAPLLRPIPELGDNWFGIDLFKDQSLFLVSLPGHTIDHLGLFIRTETENYFCVGDAVWDKEALHQNQPPFWGTKFIMHDSKNYLNTFKRLHDVEKKSHSLGHEKKLNIIPCHCEKTLKDRIESK